MTRNADKPTAVYFRNANGCWVSEDVRTVTKPAAWGTSKVITVTGRRFSVASPDIVLVY